MSITSYASVQPFQGVWELVSGEYVNHEGKLIQYKELELKSVKIISGNQFSFVTMSGDKFWSAGSGTFRIQNTEYIEVPEYNSFQSPKGAEYSFNYHIDKNTWTNARWEKDVRVEYEVWQLKE
jgi:hypothetical protein